MSAARLTPELLLAVGADLGEAPAWDAFHDALVWTDILAGLVHVTDASGEPRTRHDVGQHVGAALPTPDGSWLLAVRSGFAVLRTDGPSSRCSTSSVRSPSSGSTTRNATRAVGRGPARRPTTADPAPAASIASILAQSRSR